MAFFGDALSTLAGLCLGFWIRFRSGLIPASIPFWTTGQDISRVTLRDYLPLIAVGTALMLITFSYQHLYRAQHLLRYRRVTSIVVRSVALWLLAYLGLSLALKFDPPISRIYVLTSTVTTILTVLGWRWAFHRVLQHSRMALALRQRVIFLGWNGEAERLAEVIHADAAQPYDVLGCILPEGSPVADSRLRTLRHLGDPSRLQEILVLERADMVILANLDMKANEVVALTNLCERLMIQFKVIPSYFQILVSGLTLETVSGVPILGVEELPLDRVHNRILKRTVDVIGATVGLVLSAPLVVWFGLRIKMEDGGPVLFAQERVGRLGKTFRMYKLRSMRQGADNTDHLNQSTLREDSRLLALGGFIRRWNIDEIPQFWNVLMGDMSLVGPRPERLFHSERLADEIPHYNARYSSKPGMTGWAQVNGLRGDTDLSDRKSVV